MNDMDENSLMMKKIEFFMKEAARMRKKREFRKALAETLRIFLDIAAVSVLLATLWLPVFRVYSNSMEPTLADGEIVISVKKSSLKKGDIMAFYFNNKILLKRIIAVAGDWVNIDDEGIVYVNGEILDEPYVRELSIGSCDIELPYQVPDGRFFIMGDHRSTSVDSRSSMIGPVSQEQVIGKVSFKIWPLSKIGFVK